MAEKVIWTKAEIDTLLDLIIDFDGCKILDSKRQRNKELYDKISDAMKERGIIKSSIQCRTKFKHMKSRFLEEKRKIASSGNTVIDN